MRIREELNKIWTEHWIKDIVNSHKEISWANQDSFNSHRYLQQINNLLIYLPLSKPNHLQQILGIMSPLSKIQRIKMVEWMLLNFLLLIGMIQRKVKNPSKKICQALIQKIMNWTRPSLQFKKLQMKNINWLIKLNSSQMNCPNLLNHKLNINNKSVFCKLK